MFYAGTNALPPPQKDRQIQSRPPPPREQCMTATALKVWTNLPILLLIFIQHAIACIILMIFVSTLQRSICDLCLLAV